MDRLSGIGSKELIERLFEVGRIRIFEAGEKVFSQGETAEFLPIIVSGKIKVFRFLSPGKEVIVNVFGAGEIFAIPPALDGTIYPANAEALNKSELLLIPRAEFLGLLDDSKEFSPMIMARMSNLLRETTQSIKNLATASPEEKISRILFWLAKKESTGPPFTITLRRQDIAQMAGLATETAIRVIRGLAKTGTIKIIKGKIIIGDPEKLLESFEP